MYSTVQPKIKMYWAPEGARLLDVFEYTGRYPQFFTHVFRVQSKWPGRGWVEIAVNKEDYPDVFKDPT